MTAPAIDALQARLQEAVGEQYAVVRLLGRGGMGAVYLARDRELDRLVALKVLPPEAGDSAERGERFRREARLAARLSHPGIVPLHSFGESAGLMYFVMGYVRGESLGERLRRERRVSPDETRRLLAQVADALAYAHGKRVIHRDIKPDNILLDDETGQTASRMSQTPFMNSRRDSPPMMLMWEPADGWRRSPTTTSSNRPAASR